MEFENYTRLTVFEDPDDESTFIIHPNSLFALSNEEITQLYNAVRALKLCRQGYPVPYYITASFRQNQEFYTLFLNTLEVVMLIQHEPYGYIKSFFFKMRQESNDHDNPGPDKRKQEPKAIEYTPTKIQKT